ncbi:hypothetical protein ISS42_02610 [Candidatus Shapirobacteria bacterium]|nr:hypothetical protein [Candidatus Shapirobacteria bacterium]
MGKKRKTKKEKTILNLKRQLAQQKEPDSSLVIEKKTVIKDHFPPSKGEDKGAAPSLFLAAREIKKDLVKSLLLSLVAIGCLLLLYSR